MEFDKSLKVKLDNRVDSFIKEMEPSEDRVLTYNELMPRFHKSLKEYSILAYQEENEKFINEQLSELKENLTPAVREMTDGADEIISSLSVIEIAKIIFENGVDNEGFGRQEYRPELDDGREAIFRALRYLYPDVNKGPHKKISNKLGKYIHRNQRQNNLAQNSGCVVIIIIFAGLFSLLFTTSAI